MGSLKYSLSFRVFDKRRHHFLVSHEICAPLGVLCDYFKENRGNLVVSPKLLIVGRTGVLRRACCMLRALLGTKNVGVDSPFYFGVTFALDSVTVIVDDAVLLERNDPIRAPLVAIRFANLETVIWMIW